MGLGVLEVQVWASSGVKCANSLALFSGAVHAHSQGPPFWLSLVLFWVRVGACSFCCVLVCLFEVVRGLKKASGTAPTLQQLDNILIITIYSPERDP